MISRRSFLKASGAVLTTSAIVWAGADKLLPSIVEISRNKHAPFISELKKLSWVRDAWIDTYAFDSGASDFPLTDFTYVKIIAYSEQYQQKCHIIICVTESLLDDDELVALSVVEKLAWDEMAAGPNGYHSSRVSMDDMLDSFTGDNNDQRL